MRLEGCALGSGHVVINASELIADGASFTSATARFCLQYAACHEGAAA